MAEFLTAPVLIFVVTYLLVAIGDIPGLALDRTGMALLGAVAMVATGVLDTEAAMAAIDFPTLLLLFGLMVVSSQFRLGGFYTHVALMLTRFMDRPRRFLLAIMLASGLLSALLANDIVCLAFTPVLCVALLKRGMNPSSTVMPTLSTLTRNAFATNDITSTASTFTVSSMKMMRANSEKCACSVPRSEDSRCQLFTASTIATSNSTGTA